MNQPDSAHLFLTEGTSDKEYRLELREVDGLWETVVHYGKRGSTLKEHKKTPTPVSYEAARKEYDKALRSKTKEGYTSDVSGAVSYEAPTRDLLAYLETVPDGINDGFRRPDLAWDFNAARVLGDIGGDGIFSNFWMGPSDIAKTFAGHLACDFEAWVKKMDAPDEDSEEEQVGILVGYWENAQLGLGLVCNISVSEHFALWCDDEGELARSFPSIKRFSRVMHQVAWDGNDNSPHELLQAGTHGEKWSEDERLRVFELARSVSQPEMIEDLEEAMEEAMPGYKALKERNKIEATTAASSGVAKHCRV